MNQIDRMDILRYMDVLFREAEHSGGRSEDDQGGVVYRRGFIDDVRGKENPSRR